MEEMIELNDYMQIIQNHAKSCLKRIKKPTTMTIEDLTNDGVVMFYNALQKYKKERGEFLPYLIITLKNRFNAIVIHSYQLISVELNENDRVCQASQVSTSSIIQNIHMLSTQELKYFFFILSSPEIIIDDILSYERKLKKIIRSRLNVTPAEERIIKCKIANTILS